MPLLKVCGFVSCKKTRGILWSVWVFFAFLEVRRRNKYWLSGKFSFLNVDIWFDVTKCKFIVKNSSFEMLVVFSHILGADTKITFVNYSFRSSLLIENFIFGQCIAMISPIWIQSKASQVLRKIYLWNISDFIYEITAS